MTERERIGFLNMYFEQNLYTSKSKSIWGKTFETLKDVNWTNISKVKNLSVEFIRVFANDFSKHDWENICTKSTLSEEFIREFANHFNAPCWKYISKYVKLSVEFIKEFKYYLHLPYIIQYQNISDELKSEFESILQRKEKIAEDYSISNDFIKKYDFNRVVWPETELVQETLEVIETKKQHYLDFVYRAGYISFDEACSLIDKSLDEIETFIEIKRRIKY